MQNDGRNSWRLTLIGTPLGWALSIAVAALGIYLVVYHSIHVLAVIPYLFLIACPLMHIFMHGGHGRHPHGTSDNTSTENKEGRHANADTQ